ncbi:MAG TPA: glycosyltransferase family 4 protein [Chryseosolibacter sp.]
MTKRIKVLTFGWEFPPHITGGLGTACYGLTKSLMKQGTDILFVVPKAYGDEEIGVIDASEVVMRGEHASPERTPLRLATSRAEMRVIAVPSAIKPYTSAAPPAQAVEEWNYVIERSAPTPGSPLVEKVVGRKYKFSGSYGPSLLQEVLRYGEVASAIAAGEQFDVIHAHDWLTYPAGVAAKKVTRKPLIVHVHATEYDRASERNADPRVLAIEKEGMQRADKVIAVSEWTKNILVLKYGIKREKISVVHNGIILKRKKATAGGAPRLAKYMVTFLGRVTYQKGPQFFVEAARKVLEKFPHTHFVVGGAGDLLPQIMERVAALRLSSKFHYTGFLKGAQVDQVWSVTDVYVMPSVSEPFGIAPLEAIRAGVPVILSKQSGVSEVMPHAIKADFWDTDALAAAICSVLQHKALAKVLKANAAESLKKITWDTAARKLNKLYHEVHARTK